MVPDQQPWGYKWRSSHFLIVSSVCVALFTETLLYGFLVPIVSYMLETRLHADPSRTQSLTAALLGLHGFVALVSAPLVAHFADKAPNRRIPFLATLVGCLLGTLLLAWTPSVWALFVGRVLQGASGSATWIICLAMLADNVAAEHMGRMMGMVMSFVMAGIILGPTVAGAVLESLGYWPTWIVPVAMLSITMIAPIIMLESKPGGSTTATVPAPSLEGGDTESAPLLAPPSDAPDSVTEGTSTRKPEETAPPKNFYKVMLTNTGVLAGLGNVVMISCVSAGFNTTLPLHLNRVFHWGPLSVSLIFLAMQIPSVVLGPAVGWLRDRVGVRYPTAAGWILLAPLLWLLGVPGADQFPWASPESDGKGVLVACAIAPGVALPFVRGAGMLKVLTVGNEIQTKSPGIFGVNGGNSRMFSMQEVCFSLGMIIGPVLSGLLSETVGYYYMNATFAMLCVVMTVVCFCFF